MRIRSFAKINLGLEVLGKRDDGYHEIRTLFQTINFYDVLDFRITSQSQISLKGSDPSIPWDEDNLIYKAAVLLKEEFALSKGIEIDVVKNIPAGKGLGGGSSNAAMTLYALNKLWELRLKEDDLMALGKKIGADVPYFFKGGLCLGEGRGDEIIPLEDLPPMNCLLVLPDLTIFTSTVYERYPSTLTSHNKDSKIIRFLDSRELRFLVNCLEETVFSLYPQIKAIKSLFQSLEPELSLISGTGAAVYGLFFEKGKAEAGYEKIKETYSSLLVETLSKEAYWKSIDTGV